VGAIIFDRGLSSAYGGSYMCLQELEEMTYRRHGVWLIRRSLVISIFLLLLVTQSWSAESSYESSGELLSVSIDDSMTISVPETDRQIPLRVVYPEAGGPFPVIILSHGTFSSGKKYDPVATHWAAVE
jgi:hypothetical protein